MPGTGINNMRLSDLTLPLVLALVLGSSAAWTADFIYKPSPLDTEAAEGIRVREVTVKKGDTLSHISKRYSGRGHYYPQILLFNDIRNPHRIMPGQIVRVPLSSTTSRQAQAHAVPAAVDHPVVKTPQKVAEKQKPATLTAVSRNEKQIYQKALAAFKKGDCNNAIKLFDEFISHYPSSALLPEATLNRAECYLKLSVK